MNRDTPEAEREALARLLEQMGCPATRSRAMAGHLQRRAEQLARQRGRSRSEALAHLVRLFCQARGLGGQDGSQGH